MKKIALATGLLLLVPAVWYWTRTLVSVRSADAQVAFKPLAEIPIGQLETQRRVDLSVTTPNDAAWKRIRHSWGDPDYVVALVSKRRDYQYCFGRVGLSVRVTRGPDLVSADGSYMYGYGSDPSDDYSSCRTISSVFRTAPGSTVQIHFAVNADESVLGTPQVAPDTEVMVRPDWFSAKDNIVGLMIDEDWCIFANWSALAGFILVSVSAFLFSRARRLRKRQVARPVDVAP